MQYQFSVSGGTYLHDASGNPGHSMSLHRSGQSFTIGILSGQVSGNDKNNGFESFFLLESIYLHYTWC